MRKKASKITPMRVRRWCKSVISIAVTAAMTLSLITLPAAAEAEIVYLEENEIPESISSLDVFYLATTVAQMQEGANERYILRIGRGGDCTEAAGVNLKITDFTAKYGTDYTVSLVPRSDGEKVAEVDVPEESQTFVELFQENEYYEYERMSTEELAELMEDEEFSDAVSEVTDETLDYISERTGLTFDTDTDTDKTESDDTNPLQAARSAYTGIDAEAQKVTSSTDLSQQMQEMANILTEALVGSTLTIDFEPGESERYIAIDIEDNKEGDGDRYFMLMLSDTYGTTTNSSMSSTALTIVDNEEQEPAIVSFSADEYTAGDDSVSVTITREGAINSIVTVQLTSASGTAVQGRDFSEVDCEVIFPMGIEKRTIEIPVRTEYFSGEAEFVLKLEADSDCVIESGTATVKMTGTMVTEAAATLQSDDASAVELMETIYESDSIKDVVTADAGIDLSSPVKTGTKSDTAPAKYWGSINEYSNSDKRYTLKWQPSSGILDNYTGTVGASWKLSDTGGLDIAGVQVQWEKDGTTSLIDMGFVSSDNQSADWDTFDDTAFAAHIPGTSDDTKINTKVTTNVFSTIKNPARFTTTLYQNPFVGQYDRAYETAYIYSATPIYRPFVIELNTDGTAMKFLDEDNYNVTYSAATAISMSGANDRGQLLRYTSSNKNAITLVQPTVNEVAPYVYLKKVYAVDSDGNKVEVASYDDEAIYSRTVTLTSDLLKNISKVITFEDNKYDAWKNETKNESGEDTFGQRGIITLQPEFEYEDAIIKINTSDMGQILINGEAPETDKNGYVTYHKGDILKISTEIYSDYADSYASYCFKLTYRESKDSTTDKGTNDLISYNQDNGTSAYLNRGVSNRLEFGYYEITPVITDKANAVRVRVKTDDLKYFDQSYGIFQADTNPLSVTIDDVTYNEYTVYTEVVNGQVYSLSARTNDSSYYTHWKEPDNTTNYCGEVFYFVGDTEAADNTITLSAVDEDVTDVYQVITGKVYRPNYNLTTKTSGSSGTFPAKGALVSFGTSCGTVGEDGSFSIPWFRAMGDKEGTSDDDMHYIRYIITYNGKTLLCESPLDSTKVKSGEHVFTVTTATIDPGTGETIYSSTTEAREVNYQENDVGTRLISVENGSILNNVTVSADTVGASYNILIDGDTTTVTASISGTTKYTKNTVNDQGVVIKTEGAVENITGITFYVYNASSKQCAYSLEAEKDANGNYTAALDNTQISGGYLLYIGVTTDRQDTVLYDSTDSGGKTVASSELTQPTTTTYSNVYTGYSFVQSSTSEVPEYMNTDLPLSVEFVEMPLFGMAGATIGIPEILYCNVDNTGNNGIRITVGVSAVLGTDAINKMRSESWALWPTTKVNKWKSELDKTLEGFDDFKNGRQSEASAELGFPSWEISVNFGAYFDFTCTVVTDPNTGYSKKDTYFSGWAIWLAVGGEFQLSKYIICPIGGFPFYVGFAIEGGITLSGGRTLDLTKEQITYDQYLQENITLASTKTAAFQVKFLVEADFYIGVGVVNVFGVRGQVEAEFVATYDDPTYVTNKWGGRVEGSVGIQVDLFPFSIPFMYTFAEKCFLSFEEYEKMGEGSDDSDETSAVTSNEDAVLTLRKPYTDEDSVWLSDELSAGFSETGSYTLEENGYEHPEVKLLKLSDGSVFMVFLDNDPDRGDYDRTVLKYTIFKDGTWSEPQIIHDDNGGDYQPSICEMSDGKVMISWTSRDPEDELTGEAEDYLSKAEIFTAVIDTATGEVSEITQLTDDEYFDYLPISLYDEETGDRAVFYVKTAETEDALTMANSYANESVITYMLYSAEEGRWLDDYYYEEEVSDSDTADMLVSEWNGQRFLSSPIDELGLDAPNIADLTATTYDGYAVFAYTIDVDSSNDTNEDKELYIQLYDFDTHTTYNPIRISNDGIADGLPQFVNTGSGDDTDVKLFWYRDSSGVAYIDIRNIIENGLDENGQLSSDFLTNAETGELNDISTLYSYVSPTLDSAENASVMSDFRVTTDGGNIYVVWSHPNTYEDEEGNKHSSTELYATALVHGDSGDESETIGISWSDQYRLTYDNLYVDEPEVVVDANGNMMAVYNQFDMDVDTESENPITISDFKLKASYMVSCGEVYVTDITLSDDTPSAGDTITLDIDVENKGLTYADGYTVWLYEIKDGVPGKLIDEIVCDNNLLPGNIDSYSIDWTVPDDFEGMSVYAVAQEGGMSNTSEYTSDSLVVDAEYEIDNVTTYQDNDGYHLQLRVTNTGNTTSTDDDSYVMTFTGPYAMPLLYPDVDKTFASIPLGGIEPGKTVTFNEVMSVTAALFDESGYVDAVGACENTDGDYLSDMQSVSMEKGIPLEFMINGEEFPTEITLNVGDTMEFDITCEPTSLNDNLTVSLGTEDISVAEFTGTTLTALKAGTTTIFGSAMPYGNTFDTIEVTVLDTGESGETPTPTPEATATATPTPTEAPTTEPTTEPASPGTGSSGSGSTSSSISTSASKSGGTTTAITPAADTSTSELPFSDVSTSDWFYDDVLQVYTEGLMNGTSDTTFEPYSNVTRGMLVTVLSRAAGIDTNDYSGSETVFTDVDMSKYYAPYIAWAAENGIVDGYGDNSFGPEDAVTREQAAKIILNYETYLGNDPADAWAIRLDYTDLESIDDWAVEGIMYCTLKGIMQGNDDGTFMPLENIKRSECAAVLNRLP